MSSLSFFTLTDCTGACCAEEVKNSKFASWCATMTCAGYFRTISHEHLPVGHTHEDVGSLDWIYVQQLHMINFSTQPALSLRCLLWASIPIPARGKWIPVHPSMPSVLYMSTLELSVLICWLLSMLIRFHWGSVLLMSSSPILKDIKFTLNDSFLPSGFYWTRWALCLRKRDWSSKWSTSRVCETGWEPFPRLLPCMMRTGVPL